LTAGSACSHDQQIADSGGGANSNSDQSGSTGHQGSVGEHGGSTGEHGGNTGERGANSGEHGGEHGASSGEHGGSTGGEQSGSWTLPLPLDIYYSTPNGRVENLFGDVGVIVDREVVSVPEPGTLALFGIGLLGGLLVRRRQR
jgi:hypothetical protein